MDSSLLAAIEAVLTAPPPPPITQGATSWQTLTSRKERTVLHSNHTSLSLYLSISLSLYRHIASQAIQPATPGQQCGWWSEPDCLRWEEGKRCGGQLPTSEGHEATTETKEGEQQKRRHSRSVWCERERELQARWRKAREREGPSCCCTIRFTARWRARRPLALCQRPSAASQLPLSSIATTPTPPSLSLSLSTATLLLLSLSLSLSIAALEYSLITPSPQPAAIAWPTLWSPPTLDPAPKQSTPCVYAR